MYADTFQLLNISLSRKDIEAILRGDEVTGQVQTNAGEATWVKMKLYEEVK